jgi:UPF0176 acylphosphatase like domain
MVLRILAGCCLFLAMLAVTRAYRRAVNSNSNQWRRVAYSPWIRSAASIPSLVLHSSLSSAATASVESMPVVENGDEGIPTLSSTSDNPLSFQRALPINIYVSKEIRAHLNMRNADRKAKQYLPKDLTDVSVQTLRDIIEKRFLELQAQPYILRYQLEGIMKTPRQFSGKDDVRSAIEVAATKLPSLQLFVEASPGHFPPPGPEQAYLVDMPDPAESKEFTILSFYTFNSISEPDAMALQLEELWQPFKARGRVYVAKEGVNAQMAVPSDVLPQFRAACESLPLFKGLYLNTDHIMTREDFESSEPFRALHIRVRDQIVADGFSEPLDWGKSGREMSPQEWHEQLDNPQSIVLDCRNSYETDVGIFQNAVPLNTTFFRESWDALEEQLKSTPKDAPIMTYCTGDDTGLDVILIRPISILPTSTSTSTSTSISISISVSFKCHMRTTSKSSVCTWSLCDVPPVSCDVA